MTNTTVPQTTTGVVCGKCSTGFGKDRVLVRHADAAAVKLCFFAPVVPVVEIPTPAQVQALFAAPEATAFGRHFAACPKTGCKTVKVRNHPHVLRCHGHGKVVKVRSKQLFGKVSKAAKHVCNTACTGAVGPVCTCQCGGQNHGIGHLVTV